jgi:hypothetical protein
MEKENMQLQAQLQRNVQDHQEADDKTMELLDILDEVKPSACYNSNRRLTTTQGVREVE